MNRTRQSFAFARLSQKTERESVKTLLNDALHEILTRLFQVPVCRSEPVVRFLL